MRKYYIFCRRDNAEVQTIELADNKSLPLWLRGLSAHIVVMKEMSALDADKFQTGKWRGKNFNDFLSENICRYAEFEEIK